MTIVDIVDVVDVDVVNDGLDQMNRNFLSSENWSYDYHCSHFVVVVVVQKRKWMMMMMSFYDVDDWMMMKVHHDCDCDGRCSLSRVHFPFLLVACCDES